MVIFGTSLGFGYPYVQIETGNVDFSGTMTNRIPVIDWDRSLIEAPPQCCKISVL